MVVRDPLGNINRRDERYHPLRETNPKTGAARRWLNPVGEASSPNEVRRRF